MITMNKITLLICDDEQLFRELWSIVLNDTGLFEVTGATGYAEEAIALAQQLRPQIILMDVHMLPISGIEATQKIRKIAPATKIIGLSMHALPLYAKKMIQ